MESAYTELASKRASRDRRRAQKQLSLSAKQNERAGAGMLDVVMKNKFLLAKEDMKSTGAACLKITRRNATKSIICGLRYFFGLIRDYSSLILLRHDAPTFAPVMSVKS
ncbi:hypothetical protein DYB37_013458 [Aphanomyces astaci]|uniref:Uncharacterized protein n=1 Tax=Aphanomyces astaci TaxID=112090 RepID=A0A418ERU5_APHAT|nr:hypothetical protein DYB37_013458 [Aphanomyces astaci]